MGRSLARRVVVVALAGGSVMAITGASSAQPSTRTTCRSAATAANEFQRARQNADQAGADRAVTAFADVERTAPDDLPRDLSRQLRLSARALEDLPERASVRQVRLANARLTHGLTGVMLACDRAGVRVTIEH